MNKIMQPKHISTPLGNIEPHKLLLNTPTDEQLLYKVISIENLIRSIKGKYLHFTRVDSYTDFPGADPNDGQQLPIDRRSNESSNFIDDPDFSLSDYYNQSRSRTYACCCSLENSTFIWDNYATNTQKGKVCIVFNFGKLRAMLNHTLQLGDAVLLYNGIVCRQIFSINYGIIEYVEWNTHRAGDINPIKNTYIKDKKLFSEEQELRISLSADGMEHPVLEDVSRMQFPSNLGLSFNFKAAIENHTIQEILCAPNADLNFLQTELEKLKLMMNKQL